MFFHRHRYQSAWYVIPKLLHMIPLHDCTASYALYFHISSCHTPTGVCEQSVHPEKKTRGKTGFRSTKPGCGEQSLLLGCGVEGLHKRSVFHRHRYHIILSYNIIVYYIILIETYIYIYIYIIYIYIYIYIDISISPSLSLYIYREIDR